MTRLIEVDARELGPEVMERLCIYAESVTHRGTLTLNLTVAEIDDQNANQAFTPLHEQANDCNDRLVIVDLALVEFMDSSAIGCLLGLRKRIVDDGGRFAAHNVHGAPLVMLERLGLIDVLHVNPD